MPSELLNLIYKYPMKELIELIESAYCWEGGANAKLVSNEPKSAIMVFDVHGVSTVEHTGDVNGIYGQVSELRGKSVEHGGFKYTITSATCDHYDREQIGDGDYEVVVSGKVTVTKPLIK